jgi:uncharacterized protein YndB with AHSA1/START domain
MMKPGDYTEPNNFFIFISLKQSHMETAQKEKVTIQSTVNSPVEKVWNTWSDPAHITKWCSASPDWHAPSATNDLRNGGSFSTRMEAKDGSFGFDFGGIYDKVVPHELIEYTLGDGRKVNIRFEKNGNSTKVTETFEAEQENPVDMQRNGWQAILDNFKNYTEKI